MNTLTSHEKTLGIGVNNIDKVSIPRVQPNEFGHALEKRLGRIEGGDPSQLSFSQGHQFFAGITSDVSSQ